MAYPMRRDFSQTMPILFLHVIWVNWTVFFLLLIQNAELFELNEVLTILYDWREKWSVWILVKVCFGNLKPKNVDFFLLNWR